MKKRLYLSIICIVLSLTLGVMGGCSRSEKKEDSYTISVAKTQNGMVTASKTSATEGEEITVTVTPDEGFVLKQGSLKANGKEIVGNKFVMGKENVEITAEFIYEIIEDSYTITVAKIQNGMVTTSKTSATESEEIAVTVTPDEGFVLKQGSLKANGKEIVGNKFVMGKENVEITAEFVYEIKQTGLTFSVVCEEKTSTSYWYAEYEKAGISLTIVVEEDSPYSDYINFGYNDNVEFIISKKSESTVMDVKYSYKMLVAINGKYYFQKATSGSDFSAPNDINYVNIVPGANFYYSVKNNLTFNTGKSGYMTKIYLGYDLLNTTAEEGRGNLTINPAMRNTVSTTKSTWSACTELGCQWANCKKAILIGEDGSFSARA